MSTRASKRKAAPAAADADGDEISGVQDHVLPPARKGPLASQSSQTAACHQSSDSSQEEAHVAAP